MPAFPERPPYFRRRRRQPGGFAPRGGPINLGPERLELTESARDLARAILVAGVLPPKALNDALHIAIASVHQVPYLLTWNCAHIANAELYPRIAAVCNRLGLELPILCTPEELLGDSTNAH